MLTPRGWWFLVGVFALLAFVALASETSLTLLAITLLGWFLWEWLLFQIRAKIVVRGLKVEREVADERGRVDALWAGRGFRVRVRLKHAGWLGLPYVYLTERVPFAVEYVSGQLEKAGELVPEGELLLEYAIRCRRPGRARFEGVRVELADLQGLFYHVEFLARVAVYRVLPPLSDAGGQSPTVKRHNLLPSPGQHRFRRPGSGSELLDLRDYLPGDPPKTIAWKVSARRDRLITKEFESEVPVRCTLFVDASHSVRVGPPGQNALARLVEITAAVAQATAANRDLTGLCIVDDKEVVTYIRPLRSARHLVKLFNVLADCAGLAPATGEARVHALMPLAYAFAEEIYPNLLLPGINRVPFWLPWWWSQPAVAQQQRGIFARWLPSLFSYQRRKLARWRKRLAALLSVRYGLAPGGLALLLEDDEQFSLYLQRFLADHDVPYSLPFYDRRGRYLFASPGKVEVLSRALLRAVGKGHDNELFVLLVDLLELSEELGPLVKSVKVALARHHQVLIVCPWPPGLQPPARRDAIVEMKAVDLEQATTLRFHRAYQRLRRQFGRLTVPVVSAQVGDPARLILGRLDRLRVLGRRR